MQKQFHYLQPNSSASSDTSLENPQSDVDIDANQH